MKLVLFLYLGGFISLYAAAQTKVSIIPEPMQLKMGKGLFQLNSMVVIVSSDATLLAQSVLLNKMLEEIAGFSLPMDSVTTIGKSSIMLEKKAIKGKKPGSYEI
jgi:hypothetical protein